MERAKEAFGVINGILSLAEEVPIVGEIVSTALKIWEMAAEANKNKKNCKLAAERCKAIVGIVDTCAKEYEKLEDGLQRQHKKGLKYLLDDISDLEELVQKYLNKGMFRRMFTSKSFKKEYDEIDADIVQHIQMVQLDLNATAIAQNNQLLEQTKCIMDIHDDVVEIKDKLGEIEELVKNQNMGAVLQKIDSLNVSENSDKLDKLLEMMQNNQSMAEAQNALIRKMQSDFNRAIANTKQEVTMALEPFDFTGVLKDSLSRFHKGTREWALKAYDEWVKKKESKIFVMTGDGGMGKTGIVSKVIDSRDDVLAYHFCRHDHNEKNKPKRLLCSIAFQIAQRIPKYKEMLESMELTQSKVDEWNLATLFDTLLRTPLSKIPQEKRMVIIIDALDECDKNGKNALLTCIRDHFIEIPEWIGFFLTTRPEIDIIKKLDRFNPTPLEPDSEENMKDIAIYLKDSLESRLPANEVDKGVEILSKKSAGRFVYLRYAVEKIQERTEMTLAGLGAFPDGVYGFYENQFERIMGQTFDENHPLWRTIELVIAACEPLTEELIEAFTGCTRKQRIQCIKALSSFFPVRDHRLHVFHKSVKDFFVDPERADELLYVDVKEVHQRMGKQCMKMDAKYGIEHCIQHLYEAGEMALVKQQVFDWEWLKKRATLSIHGLLHDLKMVKDKMIGLVHGSVGLSLITVGKDLSQLGIQISGRLLAHMRHVQRLSACVVSANGYTRMITLIRTLQNV